jgi:demethylmenaquinone methyltransferase/2-methoxy-6-polyprenyl-1,4-benzoquinol methylase
MRAIASKRPARGVTRLFHEAYARHVLPAVGGLISGDRAAYDYLARSMRGFFTRDEYEAVLRAAGFEGVVGEDQTLGISAIVSASAPR